MCIRDRSYEEGIPAARISQPVRWDADIDRHALAAHVGDREVIATRGRVHKRIAEDRQRCIERGQDARLQHDPDLDDHAVAIVEAGDLDGALDGLIVGAAIDDAVGPAIDLGVCLLYTSRCV